MEVWQRMLSGRRLNLVDPSLLDIEIEDIAHGLARIARWNGQTVSEWSMSVAEHSLLVERLVADSNPRADCHCLLAALLHDASEYVLGDMIGPLKRHFGADWRRLEDRLQEEVHQRFGLPADLSPSLRQQIKRADRNAAWIEATQLAGYSETEAGKRWLRPRRKSALAIRLVPMPPQPATEAFLARYAQLLDLKR